MPMWRAARNKAAHRPYRDADRCRRAVRGDHVAGWHAAVAISQVRGGRATYHGMLPMQRKLPLLLTKNCGDLDG